MDKQTFDESDSDSFKPGTAIRIDAGELNDLKTLFPGAAAQVDVQPGDVRRAAVAVDPAVFGPDVFQVQPPQLVGQQGLQPEEAGNGVFHGPSLKSDSGGRENLESHYHIHSNLLPFANDCSD